MNKIFAFLIVLTAMMFFSCKDTTKHDCNNDAWKSLAYVHLNCSDPAYLSQNSYADYDTCLNANIRSIELTYMNCMGRGFPEEEVRGK